MQLYEVMKCELQSEMTESCAPLSGVDSGAFRAAKLGFGGGNETNQDQPGRRHGDVIWSGEYATGRARGSTNWQVGELIN
jgi:hypothetical protein